MVFHKRHHEFLPRESLPNECLSKSKFVRTEHRVIHLPRPSIELYVPRTVHSFTVHFFGVRRHSGVGVGGGGKGVRK